MSNFFAMLISTLVFLTGLLFFAFGVKNNAEWAVNLIYNIMGGIVAGLIVSMFSSVQQKGGDWLDIYIVLCAGMLVIGIIVFIMSPKAMKSRPRDGK